MNSKKIILFDIDYTLFSTIVYRKNFSKALKKKVPNMSLEELHEIIEDTYRTTRPLGNFYPKTFAKFLSKNKIDSVSPEEIEKILWDKNILESSIYEESEMTLKQLQKIKNLKMGIFSTGNNDLQRAKIHTIIKYLHNDHIHILQLKEKDIDRIVNDYKEYRMYMVDDVLEVLEKAKDLNENITTIWIKRGRFAENTTSKFSPDYTIYTLDEILKLIK